VNFNVNKVLSIVGTRKPTHYGISLCENIISDLANLSKDVIIVSGMAFGIDVTAHKAALKYGLKTVGVLAHGLDTIYPYQHRSIAKQIVQQGSLLTEFLSETTPEKSNFVKRNRIIAGMADATLVIESKRDGGAMITAEYAFSYNRDVLAIPGRTYDVTSEGPNYLIKSNKAALVESAQDICQVLSWEINTSKPEQEKLPLLIDLTEEEKKIIEALKNEGDTSIDILALKTAIPMSKISAMLLNLEFNGIVKSLPGKIYALTVKV
jgi:DNA processing protein